MYKKFDSKSCDSLYFYFNRTIFASILRSPGVHIAIAGIAIIAILYLNESLSYVPGLGWHTADDHMITQRVSFNFWNSGFPYYNINSAVAANTSLFWPILLSPLYAFFSAQMSIPVVICLSILFWVSIIVFSVSYFSFLPEKLGVAILLTLSPSALSFSATGWEHIPQTFFVTVGLIGILYCSQKASKVTIPDWAFIAICLSFLMRPDSAITIAIIGIMWLLTDERYCYIKTYVIILLLLTLPVSYLFFMDMFYGSFVPNTAHLKVGGFIENVENGLGYILSPFRSGPVPIMILCNFLAIKILRKDEILLLTVGSGHLVYVVLIGGDFFENGRMFLIYLPVMTVLTVSVVSRIMRKHSATAEIVAVSIAMVSFLNGPDIVGETIKKREVFGADGGPINEQIKLAEVIKQRIDPADGTIGLHYLGVGYHLLSFRITDFLGKAEPHIAKGKVKVGPVGHNKWNYKYAFKEYDIAVIPIRIKTHKRWAQSEEKNVEHVRHVYWGVLARYLDLSKNYRFIFPKEMGLRKSTWGAYVRLDLIGKIKR